MSKEECKGCSVIVTCSILNTKISATHSLDVWAELPNCPCNICLIKSMCGDTCDDYGKFADKIQQIMIHGKMEQMIDDQ